MKVLPGQGPLSGALVISLFDFSGRWAEPWHEAGHTVWLVDVKHGADVRHLWSMHGNTLRPGVVDTILMAPPCTDFSLSGARYWKQKDADGRTAVSLTLVRYALQLRDLTSPRVWALENPIGRLGKLLLGKPQLYFQPCDYAGFLESPEEDAYTKRTCLWGNFKAPPLRPVPPVYHTTADGKRGSWQWATLGGKSERTKTLRSLTPRGFARAFYEANKRHA